MRIWTVGHGARAIETFLAIVAGAGVGTVVDVRRFPGSRRHPQFGREALGTAVEAAGLRYHWLGETLGGRRDPVPATRNTALRNAAFTGYADHMETLAFRTSIARLLAAAELERPAILCAETVWRNCHRMLVADALALRGADVVHLLDAGSTQPHRLTEGCRRADDGWPIYDDDPSPPLPGL